MDDLKEPHTEETLLYSRVIFYSRPSSRPVPPIHCLTSRVFMPLRVGLRSYENMGQTFERINAWLRVTGSYDTDPYLQLIFSLKCSPLYQVCGTENDLV